MQFRIIKWWPGVPEAKQPAILQTFADRELAERVKESLERDMPHRQFAVEEIPEQQQ